MKQWLEKSVLLAAFMFSKVWYFWNLFDPDFLMVIANVIMACLPPDPVYHKLVIANGIMACLP